MSAAKQSRDTRAYAPDSYTVNDLMCPARSMNIIRL
jgi:hypothetical protein